MANLRCCADTCAYNTELLCCKGEITVGGPQADCSGKTCCESFSEKRGENLTSGTSHACPTISIDCEASKCRYNFNYKCTAEKVTINGSGAKGSQETACSTFEEK
ncbi:MAG: DUF1540 domain-containing protein [Lachnospiraceae bacterium]|nr:DUF1540 domain-containing protein [Lachnospiraceae bacterium]